MAYEMKMVKLVTGEMVIGKFEEGKGVLTDVAAIQTIPTQQGVQLMIMPYGYPFDQEFNGEISLSHVLYTYANCPEEMKTRYLEACSNLTLSAGGLGGLDLKNPGKGADISGLIRGK